MPTTLEALLAELTKLEAADHPIVPKILDVVREYPIQIQGACAEASKHSADPGTVAPVKTVADQQAVELQEMLDAFVAAPPAPMLEDNIRDEDDPVGVHAAHQRLVDGGFLRPVPPKPLQPAPMLPDLPGTQREGEVLSGLSHGNPLRLISSSSLAPWPCLGAIPFLPSRA